VYRIPTVPNGALYFKRSIASPYQINWEDLDLALSHGVDSSNSTSNSTNTTPTKTSSKDKLPLTTAAYPVPVDFEAGIFSVDGLTIMDPSSWHTYRDAKKSHEAVQKQSYAEMIR
jgi:hypothetical protein